MAVEIVGATEIRVRRILQSLISPIEIKEVTNEIKKLHSMLMKQCDETERLEIDNKKLKQLVRELI